MKLIAFLRGLNNAGARAVTMDYLQTVFEAEGFEKVEVFLASGNVVFEGDAEDIAGLERAIEGMLVDAIGFEVMTVIRTDVEVRAIARYTAFTPALVKTAASFNVALFRQEIDATAKQAILALRTPTDEFNVREREIYWLSRTKPGESVISNALFDRTVGHPSTLRGMKTIHEVVKKFGPRA